MQAKDSDAPSITATSRFGNLVAVDFETFYDSAAGYSLRVMTPHAYVNDPRFDPYLVSVVGETGEEYVGDPLLFDWKLLTGARIVMHNAGFDGMVLNRLIELGKIPDFERELLDSADMCAFMCVPRSLAGACKALLGIDVSKAVRADMDGRPFKSLDSFKREALLSYTADDSRLCLQLFRTYGDKWPQWERDVSTLNREATWRGVRIDRKATTEGLARLKAKKEESAAALPWTEEGHKAGSRPQFLTYVKDLGLPVPASVAKNDPGFMAWAERYKDKYPFIQARLDYASLNSHISRLEAMVEKADHDDIMRYASLYYGSHTGRCSGSAREGDENAGGKANLFNLPRGDKKGLTHGVDIRGLHVPRPECSYMIYDYGQIEARIVHWIAGDTEFLSRAAKENIYQVTAKTLGWYPQDQHHLKEEDAKLYLLSKGTELGSGFGMGGAKFAATCERTGIELPPVPKDKWVLDRRTKFVLRNIVHLDWTVPENEAKVSAVMSGDAVIQAWRRSNPKIPALWRSLEDALRDAAERHAPVHYFTLPSGRRKPYWKPHFVTKPKIVYDAETGKPEQQFENRLSAYLRLGDKIPEQLHGGPLTENLVQATARDLMFHGALGVAKEAPQWHYMFNVYDEIVFEVPLCDTEAAQKVIPELLVSGPMLAWARGLPLEVEGGPADKYTKHDDRWRKHSGMPG
jgi:hypothetical protein